MAVLVGPVQVVGCVERNAKPTDGIVPHIALVGYGAAVLSKGAGSAHPAPNPPYASFLTSCFARLKSVMGPIPSWVWP
jgi:hypothetical protein